MRVKTKVDTRDDAIENIAKPTSYVHSAIRIPSAGISLLCKVLLAAIASVSAVDIEERNTLFFKPCPRCGLFTNAMRFVDEDGVCTSYCIRSAQRGYRRGYECGRCEEGLPPTPPRPVPVPAPPASSPSFPLPSPSFPLPTRPSFPPPSPVAPPPSPVAPPPSPVAPPPSPVAPPVPVSCTARGYQISLDLTNVDSSYRSYFNSAASRWTNVVRGDLSSVDTRGISSRCTTLPSCIDDLHICAVTRNIDGVGGTLGFAGVEWSRTGSRIIPAIGFTTLDTSDIPRLISNGSFQSIITHEFGHLLGLGTVWGSNGLASNCVYRSNTRASAEFRSVSGCPSSTPVPLETTGGSGTTCSHWEEACLRGELMTGFANFDFPLSRITIGSLEDIGYDVSYSAADRFTAQDLGTCQCRRRLLKGGTETVHNGTDEHSSRRRKLSSEGYEAAVKFGREILREGTLERLMDVPNMEYFGDRMVVVYYLEDDRVHDVMVWNEE